MILRLSLNLELDTTNRQVRLVNDSKGLAILNLSPLEQIPDHMAHASPGSNTYLKTQLPTIIQMIRRGDSAQFISETCHVSVSSINRIRRSLRAQEKLTCQTGV